MFGCSSLPDKKHALVWQCHMHSASSSLSQVIVLRGVQGAELQAFPGYTFTFDTSLTPSVSLVAPARGSTEGGTQLTLTGSFPATPAGNLSVWIGDVACTNAEQVNASTITCTTANPSAANASAPKPQGPLPVRVVFAAWGRSACDAGASVSNSSAVGCSYQYVDLWSSKTTWGGGDPPLEGDTVMIPGSFSLTQAQDGWNQDKLHASWCHACVLVVQRMGVPKRIQIVELLLMLMVLLQAIPLCCWTSPHPCMRWFSRATCCLMTRLPRSCTCR